MESGGLHDIIRTAPRHIFSKAFRDLISDKYHRKHVVDVMVKYIPMEQTFNKPRGLNGRLTFNWKSDLMEIPLVLGSDLHVFDTWAEFGDEILWKSRYPEHLVKSREPRFGLEYSFDLARRSYDYAYKAGSRIFGRTRTIQLYDELADNFKNLARAVFEFRVLSEKELVLPPKVEREVRLVMYDGGPIRFYNPNKELSKKPTIH